MSPRRNPLPAPRPRPRVYVVAGLNDDVTALAGLAGAKSTPPDVAAVLLRLPDAAIEQELTRSVKALAPAVQGFGAALLLDGHAGLVREFGADGAHLAGYAALAAALPSLKPHYIAGVGGLASRHDAMLAGEAGADYVMFGEPDPSGRRPAFAAILERVAWWAEIFETPCVGYAADLEELSAIARAGAEFVALGDFVWNHEQGPASGLAAAADRLRALEFA